MSRQSCWGAVVGAVCAGLMSLVVHAQDPKPQSYLPVVIEEDFGTVMARDKAAKPEVMQRQRTLLEERYDLSNRPAAGVMMSGGRKPVQEGVRIKLPGQMTWEQLAALSP